MRLGTALRPARVGAATVVLLVGVVSVAGVAGCSGSLRNRQLSVYFAAGTSKAAETSASHACAHVVPGISPAPAPTTSSGTTAAGLAGTTDEIRFFIGAADDHDLALLTDCLHRQPGVIGVAPADAGMS